MTKTLRATVEPGPKQRVLISLPFDPDEVWGFKAAHHVAGTVNGMRIRAVVEPWSLRLDGSVAWPAMRRSVRTGHPWPAGSVTRRPTIGTTESPSSGSRPKAGALFAVAPYPRPGPRPGRRTRDRRGAGGGGGDRHPAAVPPIPGLADIAYWTNRHALEAKELPSSMVVLGGGAVDRLLPLEESEAGGLVAGVLGAEGIDVRVGARATHVGPDGRRFALTLANGRS